MSSTARRERIVRAAIVLVCEQGLTVAAACARLGASAALPEFKLFGLEKMKYAVNGGFPTLTMVNDETLHIVVDGRRRRNHRCENGHGEAHFQEL
jgi:hypothetical protein